MSRRSPFQNKKYWLAYGHRLRITRIALGLSEAQAADAHKISVKTYRRWEAGKPQREGNHFLRFAVAHDVSLDWLIVGEGRSLKRHLAVNRGGKVAILPVSSAKRQARLASMSCLALPQVPA